MKEEASDLILFFGRLHPLVLHLPIGFLVIAFVLEILSRFKRFSHFKPPIGFVLLSGAALALVTATLGYMLAQSGDYSEGSLAVHKWSGIAAALSACAALALRRFSAASSSMDRAYLSVMTLMMIFLIVAGHYGGSLTHGSDYLTEYMPDPLRKIAGLADKHKKKRRNITNLGEAEIYNDIIFPILEMRCLSCHNATKRKGGLMMHTQEYLVKGGEDGAVFIAGSSEKSDMIKRLRLPEMDEDHMPPEGKSQLTDEQIELLAWWIDEGAPFTRKIAEVDTHQVQSILNKLVDPDADKTEAEKLLASPVKPADEKVLSELKRRGLRVRPLAAEVHWLQADINSQNHEPVDSLMHAFRGVAEQLTWLNLGGTAVSDYNLDSIGLLRHLTRLHLENTEITDEGLKHLKELPYLEYLNIYGTKISDKGIRQLADLKNLRKLYLWQTGVTMEGVAGLQKLRPDLQINTGIVAPNLLSNNRSH